MTELMISFWGGPEDEASAETIVQAGFNVVMCKPDKLELCRKYGLKAMLFDSNIERDSIAEQHTSSEKRVMIYFNKGNGLEWERQVIGTTGSHSLCVADIDGDGAPDIIGANWTGDHQPIEMWQNLGNRERR